MIYILSNKNIVWFLLYVSMFHDYKNYVVIFTITIYYISNNNLLRVWMKIIIIENRCKIK